MLALFRLLYLSRPWPLGGLCRQRYNMGRTENSSSSGATKIKKGDIVRCDLDMDAGTLSFTINGADQGVCFSGLTGYELWPAVQFYSSGRIVRFLKLEGNVSSGVSRVSVLSVVTSNR